MHKKIIFLNIFSGHIGGGELYLYELINAFSKEGKFDLKIISPEVENLDFSTIKNLEITHIKGIRKLSYIKVLFDILYFIFQINIILLKNKTDYLIINGDRATTLSPFIFSRSKKIGIRHMLIEGKLKSFFSKISFIFLDKIITISKFHKLNYQNSTSSNIEINVIYNAIDTISFSYKCPNNYEKIKFLQIGSLENRKGIFDTLQAFSQLKEKLDNIQLYIIGDGELRENIQSFISKHHLNESIFLLGHKASVKEIISESHILLLPSYNEGLPLVILEAFSIGRPVITTNIAGIPELVKNNINGFLINPGDIEALEKYMLFFINNPQKILNMGIEGRNIVVKSFEYKTWLTSWLKLIK